MKPRGPAEARESGMIDDVEDFFRKGCGRCPRFATTDCSTQLWRPGLAALRRLCLDAGLEESVRWGAPCYRHAGRNVALIGALRDGFRLSFFLAPLMTDPEGVLTRSGPNTRAADTIRFVSETDVDDLRPTLLAYLAEARELAQSGAKTPREVGEIETPAELAEALEADAELAAAYARLTPGRRRSYAIALSAAKRPETRRRRINAFRDGILAGRGATER